MARFTTFDATNGVAGPAGGRAASAADFGGGAAGFQIAGKALEAFATDLQKREERADVTRIDSLQSTAMAELTGIINEFETTADLGADGHVERVTGTVNQYYDDRADQATTPAGQLKLQKQRAAVLSHLTIQAIGFQAASVGAKVKADYIKGRNDDLNTLLQNPDQATFDLILQGNLDKLNDPKGALFNGLEAPDLAELERTTVERLTKARIQGLIRQDPEQAIIDINSGKFSATIDNDDIRTLLTQASIALNGIRAADAADAKRLKELEDKVRLAEQSTLFNEVMTGADADGNPVSLAETNQKVMTSQHLKTFGPGSKDDFTKMIQLRASGVSAAEFDEAVREQKNTFLHEITTGTHFDGTKVDNDLLRERILADRLLDPFGSNGSKNLLLKLLDDRVAGVVTPLSKREQEIYTMVTTKQDADGNTLTDQQIIENINQDDLLQIEGTAGKKAFAKMVGDIAEADFTRVAGVFNDDAWQRIHLPVTDPRHLGVEDFADARLVSNVGGFEAAEKLKGIAQRVEDRETAALEKVLKEFIERFKGRITESILGARVDSEGDDRYATFREIVRERVYAARDADEDPFDLMNSGSKNYIGDFAKPFGIGVAEAAAKIQGRIEGTITPFLRSGKVDPTKWRPGETAEEYFKRRGLD